jgi:hypothetical protein
MQDGGMPDLLWDQAKNFFDPDLMGALPDLHVADVSVAEWQQVFDLFESGGWPFQFRLDTTPQPLLSAEEAFEKTSEASVDLLVRFAPEAKANFYLHSPEQIDFDVDLRELQGQDRVDDLCDFLSRLGRMLERPVLMTAEGLGWGYPVLGFDPVVDRVVLMADPALPDEAG